MANNEATENNWVDEKIAALHEEKEWQPDVQAAMARFFDRRTENHRVWRRWAMAATVAAAACLFAMFIPPPQVLAHRCLECSVAVWESLSGQTETKLVGQPAPDFVLQDANGNELKLSELKGKVVLVNFWATWCHGCQEEIPWFVEFTKKYSECGLVVVGVSMDSDGWKEVRPWIKEKNVNYAIVIGYEELAKKYGLDGMPLTVLVGRDGKIAEIHAGVVDREATEKIIVALLGAGALGENMEGEK
jgi:peroxiredoxin